MEQLNKGRMEKSRIVKKIYSKIDEIPTLSPVLLKVMNLIESSGTGADDLTKVISRDPSLTSKILKVANSAYYGFAQTVDNLDRAVVLLGFNMVKSLAMSAGIIRALPPQNKAAHFSRERLWIHCLAVATIMREAAEKCGRKDESDSLFIAGLLHDIGKIVLDQFFTEEYQQALEESGCLESISVCAVEEKYFGMDHGEVGSILLKRWNFPVSICRLVAMDHKTEVPDDMNAADVSILHMADILSKEAGMGVSESIASSGIEASDLEVLGMSDKDIDALRDFLDGAKDGIFEFYNSIK